jgi:hypothetical protein
LPSEGNGKSGIMRSAQPRTALCNRRGRRETKAGLPRYCGGVGGWPPLPGLITWRRKRNARHLRPNEREPGHETDIAGPPECEAGVLTDLACLGVVAGAAVGAAATTPYYYPWQGAEKMHECCHSGARPALAGRPGMTRDSFTTLPILSPALLSNSLWTALHGGHHSSAMARSYRMTDKNRENGL